MGARLEFAEGLSFPRDAVTETFAFIGRKGAGKTYAAGRFTEELLEAQAQVIVLDTVGNWYGLRLSASGKRKGYDLPVLGGEQGDIPLEKTGGALVADVLVDTTSSMVLDLTLFSQGALQQFMTDFAERFFERKKTQRSPVHLVIEEAQRLIPQQTQGKGGMLPRLKGAMEQIIRIGRNYGIGVSMLTQRPQSVDKEVLNQTECLCVFQTTGPHERKAIKDWIVEKGLDLHLLEELPSLPVGVAFVWSPQWLNILGKYRVLKKRTYDASSTPRLGEQRVPPRSLDTKALGHLRTAMAASIEKAQENDPTALKARIRVLEREVAELKKRSAEAHVEVKEVPVFGKKERKLLEDVLANLKKKVALYPKVIAAIEGDSLGAGAVIAEVQRVLVPRSAIVEPTHMFVPKPVESPRRVKVGIRTVDRDDEFTFIGKMRDIMRALHSVEEHCLSRKQLAVMVGLSASSGGFNNYIGKLSKGGFIGTDKGLVALTELGMNVDWARGTVARTPDEILQLWLPRLTGKQRDILCHLFENPGTAFQREEIADQVGLSASSGGFNNYVGKLKGLNLVVTGRGQIELNREVFRL